MAVENIELLRDEAQRLLKLSIEKLETMMLENGLITVATDSDKHSQQTFDKTSTPELIEVLKGELTKLNNMELVIAVVGTMKAGKSTTINAIVGAEVLPNRNRPMTALPTLIRHTPKQIEPILKFDNDTPINILFDKIRERIDQGDIHGLIDKLSSDSEMKELIGNITKKVRFRNEYTGAVNIFECLRILNDLVRLSNELSIDFPFSEYSNIDQMPVISVEFAHLKDDGETHGQLTLLDTPGPNEAGQDHLRDMLREQLKKTSAILAVFDYTQLKSDADEDVRSEIKTIAKLHKGRLFALVNKFDQKDRNGDGKEDVKLLVADKLMEGLLEKEQVFPVSSKWCYLANRAKHEISTKSKLPNISNETEESSWVEDFALEAFGRRWEGKIDDKDEVISHANELLEDSGFREPMEKVINTAHRNAALLSIDSAAKKLDRCTNDLQNFFGTRSESLNKSVQELQAHIAPLVEKITTIESLERTTKDRIQTTKSELVAETKSTVLDAKKNSQVVIEKYFKEGKLKEKEEEKRLQNQEKQLVDERKSQSLKGAIDSRGLFGHIWGHKAEEGGSKNKTTTDFKANKKIHTFKSQAGATKLINKIQSSVETSIQDGMNKLNSSISNDLAKFSNNFERDVNQANKIISTINQSMSEDGYRVKLKSADTTYLERTFKNNKLSLKDRISSTTAEESYTVEKDGALSWLARKLWGGGSEKRYRDVTTYTINIDEIKASVVKEIDSSFDRYSKAINKTVITPVYDEVDTLYNELKTTISHVRGDLQQSIRDKEANEKAELDGLKDRLDQLAFGVPEVAKDSELLNDDINNMVRGNEAA